MNTTTIQPGKVYDGMRLIGQAIPRRDPRRAGGIAWTVKRDGRAIFVSEDRAAAEAFIKENAR